MDIMKIAVLLFLCDVKGDKVLIEDIGILCYNTYVHKCMEL